MNKSTLLSLEDLDNAVDRLEDFCFKDDGSDVYMTAIVKAWEFTIETLRKSAGKILFQAWYSYNGPKDIFKILLDREVFDQQDVMILSDFLDYRNTSAHKYWFQIIEEVYPFIKEHYQTLITCSKKLHLYLNHVSS